MKKMAIFIVLAAFLLPVMADDQQYEPSIGQQGKDVIWVPTPDELVKAMLDLADVSSDDFLMDLGSGDGRIVIAAAKRGAHATGIEYNPDMVELSKRNAEKAGVSDRATFLNADLFTVDLTKATVISMYLLPTLNMKLRPVILELKPGTRIVSNSFTMEDWQWDNSEMFQGRTAYLWIVPAKVQGIWTMTTNQGTAELTITQKFQKIDGTLKLDGKTEPLKEPRLQGSQIRFAWGGQEFTGQISGRSMEGLIKTKNGPQKWSATLR